MITQTDWSPDRKKLRSFGWISVLVFGLLGTWLRFRGTLLFWDFSAGTAVSVAWVLWGVAACCGVLAMAAPGALLPLYAGLMLLALPIGFVVSHTVLALIYYGILTPAGAVIRLTGRDPLTRKIERESTSYWHKRPPVRSAEQFFRQF